MRTRKEEEEKKKEEKRIKEEEEIRKKKHQMKKVLVELKVECLKFNELSQIISMYIFCGIYVLKLLFFVCMFVSGCDNFSVITSH